MADQGTAPCGCCAGAAVRTPRAAWQRPGLPVIAARAGDYHAFLDTMIARLSSGEHGALSDLRARDAGTDFSIALLDAWAVSADILTFYTERLTSETLLETAGETWSLHELARLIGYRPHPGVSASAALAFTMAETPGAPRRITLPSGVKVQSTPDPDEAAVIFETSAPAEARPAWNAMRPRQTAVQALGAATTQIHLDGAAPGVSPGDGLFYVADDGTPIFAVVLAATVLPADDPGAPSLTRLTIDPIATPPLAEHVAPPAAPLAPTFPPEVAGLVGATLTAGALTEALEDAGVTEEALFAAIDGAPETPKRVLVFREAAGVFGNAAPSLSALPPTMTGDVPVYGTDESGAIIITGLSDGPYKGVLPSAWADGALTVLADGANAVHLDRASKTFGAGGVAALKQGDVWGIYAIDAAREAALSAFAISARTTRLELTSDDAFASFAIRETTVFGASQWIDLPRAPRTDAIRAGAAVIELDTLAPGLMPGGRLALTGTRADGLDAPVALIAEIAEVAHHLAAGGATTVTLSAALVDDFDRGTLRINGNVVDATHGETHEEVLGGGDPATPFFAVHARQKPLTHVTAPVPGGALAAADLRVGGILWTPAPDLLSARPHDRVYTIRTDTEGAATFGFGDGAMGAAPPAGQGVVTLTYRTGLGLAGRVRAGRLDILMTRPLGVDGVANPLPAEGGADPEAPEALRSNLPLSCRTLDRVVSLTDFADFARGYGGIAKARADWAKFPGAAKAGVAVTVAGEDGAEVPRDSDLHGALRQALTDAGIPYARFRLNSYRPRYFRLAARVKPLGDRIPDDVLGAVEAALRAAYCFEVRDFAAPVFASEVIATMQTVDGVEAAALDLLYLGASSVRRDALTAERATATAGAELLMLHPGPLDYLELMS